MTSFILSVATRFLLPVLMLYALFLLLRGHQAPGGGFSAGLVVGASVGLYSMAFGPEAALRIARVPPRLLIGLGLLCAVAAGLAGPLVGRPFLSGRWIELPLAGLGTWTVGTPLLFDAGVFLVVTGVVSLILVSLVGEV